MYATGFLVTISVFCFSVPSSAAFVVLTNLIESVNDWTISIENKIHNRVAYIDFSRAFDSVSHAKLLHKLKSYGIDGILLDWIADFLSERLHSTMSW